MRRLYRTAWEIRSAALIDMAAARTPYLDQAQSLNLFLETPTIGKLSSMYAYAWKQGLKTTYYLRSRPATRIARAAARTTVPVPQAADPEAVALLPGKPRVLRGLPVIQRNQEPARPGFELTLRPHALHPTSTSATGRHQEHLARGGGGPPLGRGAWRSSAPRSST
ncbi:hypothetical protein GCM10023238_20830 [Streptomyces heliomycini]